MNRLLIIIFAGTLIFFSATTFQSDHSGSHDINPKVKQDIFRVLDDFMKSFNERDRKAHYATYHFPHYRLASGKMTILQKPESDTTVFLERLIQTGWHHSQWDHRNIVQASADKVHVDTQFTRYREDGTKIKTYESLYILTFEKRTMGNKDEIKLC